MAGDERPGAGGGWAYIRAIYDREVVRSERPSLHPVWGAPSFHHRRPKPRRPQHHPQQVLSGPVTRAWFEGECAPLLSPSDMAFTVISVGASSIPIRSGREEGRLRDARVLRGGTHAEQAPWSGAGAVALLTSTCPHRQPSRHRRDSIDGRPMAGARLPPSGS